MVPIDRERRALERQEELKRSAPPATDQVSRLTAAHESAAAAATAAVADDASESTVRRAANEARSKSLKDHAPTSSSAPQQQKVTVVARDIASLVPPEDGPAVSVHAAIGEDGTMPPLSMQSNYDDFRRFLTEQAATSASAAIGHMGERIMLVSNDLVRRVQQVSKGSGGVPTQLPRLMVSSESPLESTFLKRLVTETVRSAEVPPHLNYVGDTVDEMRQYLVPSRRAHEEQMFRVPLPGEPACPRGAQCRGHMIVCAEGGATLISYQEESVWQRYMSDRRKGLTDSRLPQKFTLCLLCIRFDVECFLVSMRNDNVQLRVEWPEKNDSSSAGGGGGPPPALIQPHFNLTDVPGEYRLEDCNAPVGTLYEGLLYPIVKPSLRCFLRTTCPETGVVMFRQLLPYPDQMAVDSRSMPPPSLPVPQPPRF
jgi:hypothetical protein